MSNPLALVIEDDAAVADAYIEALREAGFETEVALNGNAGLARLAATTPDLVVLDMRLPFVSGTEILRQIRADERLKQTRVIITTGDSQMAAALDDEADLALVKPVSQEQLTELAARLRPGPGGAVQS